MIKRYEVAIIDRSLECFPFIIGFSVHPKDEKDDFLEINFYIFFIVLHIKIFY
tara:strand:- start:142 stop:300 length:159 start_codon:yes stop_codon:yes gene_type:complete